MVVGYSPRIPDNRITKFAIGCEGAAHKRAENRLDGHYENIQTAVKRAILLEYARYLTSRPAIAGSPRCKNITAKSVHLTSLYHMALTSTNDHLSVLRHYRYVDTYWQRSMRYWGALLCRQLNTLRPSLNATRYGTLTPRQMPPQDH